MSKPTLPTLLARLREEAAPLHDRCQRSTCRALKGMKPLKQSKAIGLVMSEETVILSESDFEALCLKAGKDVASFQGDFWHTWE